MEQTSSTAYPNLLVVDYLKSARRADPETLMKAEHYLNVGYQKILTFQNPNGGFGWWAGGADPVVWVTAYGLQELQDMRRVMEVDESAIERAQKWLIKQQDKDGAWRIPGHTHGVAIERLANPEIGLTGYVAWTLAETGFQGPELDKALRFLEDHLDEASENPYALALAANALARARPEGEVTKLVLRTLDGMKEAGEHGVFWTTGGQTLCYGRGDAAAVEVTALVAYAMQQAGSFTSTVNKALSYLVAIRGSTGSWGSTQATILALKALVRGLAGEKLEHPATVVVSVNGAKREVVVDPDQADVLRLLDFAEATRKGRNEVRISSEGASSLMYQVISRTFLPGRAEGPATDSPLAIQLSYDRTELATDDILTARLNLRYRGEATTYMVIVDLGLPPGFSVEGAEFAALVRDRRIEKYSITSRQVTLYLGGMKPGQELDFSYSLRAKYPIKAKSPRTTAYEYYTPSSRAEAEPVELTVH